MNPPYASVVLRYMLMSQMVGIGECQSGQTTKYKDIANACQPTIKLFVRQCVEFSKCQMLFGLRFVFF